MTETKTCGACRAELPLDAFGPDRQRRDGLNARCRPCVAARSRRYYAGLDPSAKAARLKRQRAYVAARGRAGKRLGAA